MADTDTQSAPQPGRRAKLTQDALVVASNKVVKALECAPALALARKYRYTDTQANSDKAMRQCFPQRWADEYPDLVPGLRDMVVSTYNDGVPVRPHSHTLRNPL